LQEQYRVEQDEIHLLYDLTHHGVHFEEYNGKRILMHRFDANMTYPAGNKMLENKKWFNTGNPVFIAGQGIGNPNYVVVAGGNSILTINTVCHGLGKKENITPDAAIRKYGYHSLRKSIDGIIINNNKDIDYIPPRASKLLFKTPDDVFNSLESGDIISRVAEILPLCSVKG